MTRFFITVGAINLNVSRIVEQNQAISRRLDAVEEAVNNPHQVPGRQARHERFVQLPNFPIRNLQELQEFEDRLINDENLQGLFVRLKITICYCALIFSNKTFYRENASIWEAKILWNYVDWCADFWRLMKLPNKRFGSVKEGQNGHWKKGC